MFGVAVFDNRQLAIVLWLGVAVVGMLTLRASRRALWGAIATAASPKLAIPLGFMTAYVGGVVIALWAVRVWTSDLFSEALFWFGGTALVLFVSLERANRDPQYFRRTAIRVLSLTVFVQFVVNLYPMSLFVELLLVPTSVALGGMIALSQVRPEFKGVRGCVGRSTAFLGVILLLYSIGHVVQDPGSAFTVANGRDLLVPIALTLALVPLLYLIALYVSYDSLLSTLHMILDEQPDLCRRARRRLFLHSALRLRSIIGASQAPWWIMLSRPASQDEVDDVIAHIRSRRPHALALPAMAKQELALLTRKRPPGWEYALFAARLGAGARALGFVHPVPDHSGRAFAGTPNERRMIELIQSDNRDAVALLKDLEPVFDHGRVERAFGRRGEPGHAQRIIDLAEALILGNDRMLAWTDRSRATKAPNRLATLTELHSHLLDQPNRQIEDYIDRWNDVANRIPELVDSAEQSAEPVTLNMSLRLTIDQNLLDRFTAEAERLRRAA